MDDSKRFKILVEKGTSDVVEITKKLQLKVEFEEVNDFFFTYTSLLQDFFFKITRQNTSQPFSV